MGSCLAVAFCLQCHSLVSKLNQPTRTAGFGVTAAVAKMEVDTVDTALLVEDSIDRMAREDPIKLLQEAKRRYGQEVVDYTCSFRKQELLDGKITEIQGAKVKFRDKNHSVFMHWVENPGKARRVIYVEGKWNKDGKPAALCQPEGAIARALLPKIEMAIHGPEAKAASRRSIDQFGFANGLNLILKYSLIAQERGELKLTFVGEGAVDGRASYVFERVLPYTGEGGEYPDRVLVYHLDKETLLPLSCASYADDDKKELLGKYVYSDVQLNVGLSEADFEGETYKM
ncbi:MAG: DUF1571 domain-containing protein [Phycisphaerae bacterium]|nr:DUF1571 domain-containing protein [Phycisphaerae bacterium]